MPALSEIVPRHVAYVRMLVARLGVSPAHERDDLVQDVLVQAHRSRDSALDPRALLFGITRHVVFRWISKRGHERELLRSRAPDDAEGPTQRSAEEDWQEAERRAVVRAAVGEIPTPFRDVFVCCEIDDTPMREVAESLGIPTNTGYSRLRLARARFAESIRRYVARNKIGPDEL